MFRHIKYLPILVIGMTAAAAAGSALSDVVQKCGKGADQYIIIEGCSAIIANAGRPDPRDFNTYYARGWAYNRVGAYKRALDDARQVIKFQPKNVRGYLVRGQAHYGLKKYASSVADFDQVLRLRPDADFAYVERARAKIGLKRLDGALSDLNRAIGMKRSGDAYFLRGRVRKMLGQPQQAASDWVGSARYGGKPWIRWWKGVLKQQKLYTGAGDDRFDPGLSAAIAVCARTPAC